MASCTDICVEITGTLMRCERMSEYQYYEFAAIDRPLTRSEMNQLRGKSSRADITPRGLVNHYRWGGLKADPIDWMQRYFDAFVYLADRGSCDLSLRLPKAALDAEELQPFLTSRFSATCSDTHWILWWTLSESEDYDRYAEDDGSGWIQQLIPLRDELLRSDIRPLYLGWLAAVDECGEDEIEPEVPAGLAELSPAQKAFVAFMEIDPDMLEAASSGSAAPDTITRNDEAQQITNWLETWPVSRMQEVFRRVAQGQGRQAELEVQRSYATWLKAQRPEPSNGPRRTVATLRELARSAATARQVREAEAHAQLVDEVRRQREGELRRIMETPEKYWAAAHTHASRGTASGYDKTVQILKVLAQGHELICNMEAYERGLQDFRAAHGKRPALLRRLNEFAMGTVAAPTLFD